MTTSFEFEPVLIRVLWPGGEQAGVKRLELRARGWWPRRMPLSVPFLDGDTGPRVAVFRAALTWRIEQS
ncbi:hypothetical protein [Streptomyces sp. NPDC002057]|uniref:hypothetical protein n=1 Tax=Streptomyces sp. NPDC002057 TaxID=3154664 RepID=UPI003328FA4B